MKEKLEWIVWGMMAIPLAIVTGIQFENVVVVALLGCSIGVTCMVLVTIWSAVLRKVKK